MRKFISLLFTVLPLGFSLFAQSDEDQIRKFYDSALNSRIAYDNLEFLCKNTAGRISGTPEAAAAVEFTYQVMLDMHLDKVWKQDCMVKRWVRGEAEESKIVSKIFGTKVIPVTALGLSVGTGTAGLSAKVIEVHDFAELKKLGDQLAGKIVFFNRPMDQSQIKTFSAYGGAVKQRTQGPAMAARYGAVGCVVRSVASELDDYPHTRVTTYADDVPKIPAVAISTNGSELLSAWLREDPGLRFFFRTTCHLLPDVPSHNVIGQITGTEFPNQIITIGAHLDAWETGEGAQDDGGGCMQSIEVLRLFKEYGIRPRHTIRAVMFMDEEIAQRGGKAYAKEAMEKNEVHIAAMETDRGVMTPRFVTIGSDKLRYEKALNWEKYFEPYGLRIVKGGGGADIGPLKAYYPDIVWLGMIPDDQRYFRFHHSPFDTFEQVDRREMQMGSAIMASLIYLFDKYGL
ncbi:MAG: M20/M25/M40 family metallo-hydrolase [Bacteroidales bacterium]|nr:M20/M25/M40 family metallo-hydrolase [Bacteroidales bacterium]